MLGQGSWTCWDDDSGREVGQWEQGRGLVVRLNSSQGTSNLRFQLLLEGEGEALRAEVHSDASVLSVDVDPHQAFAEVERLDIRGDFKEVTVKSPIWPDTTEMGTADIEHLSVIQTETLNLGGDELVLGMCHATINHQTSSNHGFNIIKDSRVFIKTVPLGMSLTLEENAFLDIGSNTYCELGSAAHDAELSCSADFVELGDWSVEACSGSERLQLNGVDRLDYKMLRRVVRALDSRGPNILSTYAPKHADRLPVYIFASEAAQSDWVREHLKLVEAYCSDPAVIADARWLAYDHRRRLARPGSGTWVALNLMRMFGFGLKTRPPLIAWACAVATVVGLYCLNAKIGLDPAGGYGAYRKAVLMWLEALLLPAGLVSLSDAPANSELLLSGTGARLARIASSVPFAALLFAVQARVRLPKLSEARA